MDAKLICQTVGVALTWCPRALSSRRGSNLGLLPSSFSPGAGMEGRDGSSEIAPVGEDERERDGGRRRRGTFLQ
jgi:hypothetical protein